MKYYFGILIFLMSCDAEKIHTEKRFSVEWISGIGLVCDTKTGNEYLFVDRSGAVVLLSTCEKRSK